MNNNISPDYLSELIPTQVDQPYTLSNTLNVPSLSARTQLYSSSFRPQTVRDWNSLTIDLRNSPPRSVFKPSLNHQANKSTQLFNAGPRHLQILHTRLRLDCSSLNCDLYRRNLVESQHCDCGAVETPTHVLLSCCFRILD